MSIRLKLIVLVIFTSLAGASSLFINNIMTGKVQAIENEQKLFESLSYKVIDYIAQVNRLDSEIFNEQVSLVLDKQTDLNNTINQLRSLKELPSINSSIASSVKNILTLTDKLKMSQSTLESRVERVQTEAEDVLGQNKSFTIFDINSDMIADEKALKQVQQEVSFLRSSITTLNENMNSILDQIDEQYHIILDEIAAYQKNAKHINWIILLFVFTVPLLVAIVIANAISTRVQRIDVGIFAMKEGNLADRIDVKSRDEMGRLSRNVNDFTDSLSLSIQKIKETSKSNLDLKDTLVGSVQKVSETTELVNDSIQTISSGMAELDGTVQTNSTVVKNLEDRLATLDTVQQEQISMVEETNAAITEMVTSIANVTEITQRKKTALTTLVEVSKEGGAKLEETNKKIERINNNITEIRKTAGIIQDIADSTNLLAMNASIEAAHAGASGKGFAVVASEIRKLAEATSQNSTIISKIMTEITTNIKDAVHAGTNTQKAFQSIDNEVIETTDSFDEIERNMVELRAGGTQIFESMARLNEISSELNTIKSVMWDAAGENKTSIGNVERISAATTQKIQEIIQALSGLMQEMDAVTQVTQKSEALSKILEDETAVFKLDEDKNTDQL